jgi:uncharacterized protein YpuA (DUF1002 family)
MDQGTVYKLADLVNSDFEMQVNDPDYRLNHDELIKVCKVLLHKINFNSKRINLSMEVVSRRTAEQVAGTEESMRSQTEEVNQFLQVVHQDFESFLGRHKKEH